MKRNSLSEEKFSIRTDFFMRYDSHFFCMIFCEIFHLEPNFPFQVNLFVSFEANIIVWIHGIFEVIISYLKRFFSLEIRYLKLNFKLKRMFYAFWTFSNVSFTIYYKWMTRYFPPLFILGGRRPSLPSRFLRLWHVVHFH